VAAAASAGSSVTSGSSSLSSHGTSAPSRGPTRIDTYQHGQPAGATAQQPRQDAGLLPEGERVALGRQLGGVGVTLRAELEDERAAVLHDGAHERHEPPGQGPAPGSAPRGGGRSEAIAQVGRDRAEIRAGPVAPPADRQPP